MVVKVWKKVKYIYGKENIQEKATVPSQYLNKN